MRWNIGEVRSLFLKLMSNLGFHRVVLKTPEIYFKKTYTKGTLIATVARHGKD